MRRPLLLIISSALGVGIMVLSVTTHRTAAHAATGCGPATIFGTYGFAISGLTTDPTINSPQSISSFYPIAGAGTFTFDGESNVSRSFAVSYGGVIFPVTDSGKYSLDSTCTGTATFTKAGETWNLVVTSGGKSIGTMIASPGRVVAGTLSRQSGE